MMLFRSSVVYVEAAFKCCLLAAGCRVLMWPLVYPWCDLWYHLWASLSVPTPRYITACDAYKRSVNTLYLGMSSRTVTYQRLLLYPWAFSLVCDHTNGEGALRLSMLMDDIWTPVSKTHTHNVLWGRSEPASTCCCPLESLDCKQVCFLLFQQANTSASFFH